MYKIFEREIVEISLYDMCLAFFYITYKTTRLVLPYNSIQLCD